MSYGTGIYFFSLFVLRGPALGGLVVNIIDEMQRNNISTASHCLYAVSNDLYAIPVMNKEQINNFLIFTSPQNYAPPTTPAIFPNHENPKARTSPNKHPPNSFPSKEVSYVYSMR